MPSAIIAEDEPLLADPRLTAQGAISDEALRKAEEFVEQEEGAANRLSGFAGIIATAIAVAMTLFHLYAAYDIVPTQPLRYAHVAFVMVLCFLLFPLAARFRNRIKPWDVAAAAVFLSSDILAGHITGQNLIIAGGMEGRLLWPYEGD